MPEMAPGQLIISVPLSRGIMAGPDPSDPFVFTIYHHDKKRHEFAAQRSIRTQQASDIAHDLRKGSGLNDSAAQERSCGCHQKRG